jgi:hypothetical protein
MSFNEKNGRPDPGPRLKSPPKAAQRRLTTWLFVTISVFVLIFGLLAVMRLIVARQIPALTDAALDAALERWDVHGPENYSLEVEIEGLRPGTVTVDVRQGIVTRMTRDGHVPAQRRTWDVWSVPGMFDMIEREMELAEDPAGEMNVSQETRLWIRCQFEEHYGYPAEFHRAVFGGGPEVYWRVSRFEVL